MELPPRVLAASAEASGSDSEDAVDDASANDRNAMARSKRSHCSRKGERRRRPDDRHRDRKRKKPPLNEPAPPSSGAAAQSDDWSGNVESNVYAGQNDEGGLLDDGGDNDGDNDGNNDWNNYGNSLGEDAAEGVGGTAKRSESAIESHRDNNLTDSRIVNFMPTSTSASAAPTPSRDPPCITARLETGHGVQITTFELTEALAGSSITSDDAASTDQSQASSTVSSTDLSVFEKELVTPEPSPWLKAALKKRTQDATISLVSTAPDNNFVVPPSRVHARLMASTSLANDHAMDSVSLESNTLESNSAAAAVTIEEELRSGGAIGTESSAPEELVSGETQSVEELLKLAQSQLREIDRKTSSSLTEGLAAVESAHFQYEASQVAALSTERACRDAALSRSMTEALVRGLADQDPDFNRWRDEEDMPASWRLDVPTRATRQSAANAAASSTDTAGEAAATAAQDSSDDVVCAVCHTGIVCSDLNQLVYCDGCNVVVHQGCGGIPHVSSNEDWYCAACSAGLTVNVDDAKKSSIFAQNFGQTPYTSRNCSGKVIPPPPFSAEIGGGREAVPVLSENRSTEAESATPLPPGSINTPIVGTLAADSMPNKLVPSPLSRWTICCPVYHGGVKPVKASNTITSADSSSEEATSTAASSSSSFTSAFAPDAGLIEVDADDNGESVNQWVHLACCVWQEGVQIDDLGTIPSVDVTHVRAQPLQHESTAPATASLLESLSPNSTEASSTVPNTTSTSATVVADKPTPNSVPSDAITSSTAVTKAQELLMGHLANEEVALSDTQAPSAPLDNSFTTETTAVTSEVASSGKLQEVNSIVESSAPMNLLPTDSIVLQASGPGASSGTASAPFSEPLTTSSTMAPTAATSPTVRTDDRAAALAEQRRLQETQIAELQRALREKQAASAVAPSSSSHPLATSCSSITPRRAPSSAAAAALAADVSVDMVISNTQSSTSAVPHGTSGASIDSTSVNEVDGESAKVCSENECCVCGLVGGYLVSCSGDAHVDAPKDGKHPPPSSCSSSTCKVRFHALCGWFAGFCMLASMEPNANFVRKESGAAAYRNNNSGVTVPTMPRACDQSAASAQTVIEAGKVIPAPSALKAYPVGLVRKAFCPLHVPASHRARNQAEQTAIRGKYRLQPPSTFGAATANNGGGSKGRKRARSSSGAARDNKRGLNRQRGDSAVELVGMANTNKSGNRNSNVGFSVVDGYTEYTCAVCLEPRANVLGDEMSLFGQLSKPTLQCNRCSILVHYGCYGLALDNKNTIDEESTSTTANMSEASAPITSWLCDACEATGDNSSSTTELYGASGPRCVLCPRGGGVHVRASVEKRPLSAPFSSSSSSSFSAEQAMPLPLSWAHLACAISVPGSQIKSDELSKFTLPPMHAPQETTMVGNNLETDNVDENAATSLPTVAPSSKVLRRRLWVDASLALDPNAHVKNPSVSSALPAPSRPKPKCPFCGLRSGICVPCADPKCITAFHPICAQLAGCFSTPAPGSDNLFTATRAPPASTGEAVTTSTATIASSGFSGGSINYCRRHAPPGWTRLEPLDSEGIVVRPPGGKQFARGKVASGGNCSNGPAQWVHINLARSLKRCLEQGQQRLTTVMQRDEIAAAASVGATQKFYASLETILAARGCATGPSAAAAAAIATNALPNSKSDDAIPLAATSASEAPGTSAVPTNLSVVGIEGDAPAAVVDPWVLDLHESLKLVNDASALEASDDAQQWSTQQQQGHGESGHQNHIGQSGSSSRSRNRSRKSELPSHVDDSSATGDQPVPPEAMVAAALAAAKAVLSSPPPPPPSAPLSAASSAQLPGSPSLPQNSNGKKRKGRPPGSGSKQRFHAAAQAATAAATHAAAGLATDLFTEGGLQVAVSAAVKAAMDEVHASSMTTRERSGSMGRARASSTGSVNGSSVASGDGWGNSGSANGSRAESFDHDDSTWASFASNSINSKSNSGSSSSTTGAGGGIPTNSHVDWVADLGFGDSSDGLSLMETNVAAGVDGAMPLFPAGSTMFSSELIDSHVPTNALFPERSSEFPSSSAPKRMKTSHAKAHNATSNNKAGAGAKMKTINTYFSSAPPSGPLLTHAAERAAQCVSRIEASNAARSAAAAGTTANSGAVSGNGASSTGISGSGSAANGNKESALRHARQAPSCVFRGVSERMTHPPTSFGDALRFAILPDAFPVLSASRAQASTPHSSYSNGASNGTGTLGTAHVDNLINSTLTSSSSNAVAVETAAHNTDSSLGVGAPAVSPAVASAFAAADELAAADISVVAPETTTTAARVLLDRQLLELYHTLEQKRVSVADAPADNHMLNHSEVGVTAVGAAAAGAGSAQTPMRLLCDPFLAKPDPNVFRKLYEECELRAKTKHVNGHGDNGTGSNGEPLCMLVLKDRVQQRVYSHLEDLIRDVEILCDQAPFMGRSGSGRASAAVLRNAAELRALCRDTAHRIHNETDKARAAAAHNAKIAEDSNKHNGPISSSNSQLPAPVLLPPSQPVRNHASEGSSSKADSKATSLLCSLCGLRCLSLTSETRPRSASDIGAGISSNNSNNSSGSGGKGGSRSHNHHRQRALSELRVEEWVCSGCCEGATTSGAFVGRRVAVRSAAVSGAGAGTAGDAGWFCGIVDAFEPLSRQHRVVYECDGTWEYIHLACRYVRYEPPTLASDLGLVKD